MSLETIAQTTWEYSTRTLAGGVPDPPVGRAEEIAKAVWEYVTRTLTASGPTLSQLMRHRKYWSGTAFVIPAPGPLVLSG